MATAASPGPNLSSFTPSPRLRLPDSLSKPTSPGFRFIDKAISFASEKPRIGEPLWKPLPLSSSGFGSASASATHSFDVVVIGAGIIGLTIARQFLLESDLSVAVVDAATPCAGATGAGQGYIWMMPKTPGTDIWELSMRSQRLWTLLVESIQHQGGNPSELMGWMKTGSLLIGRSLDESVILKKRVSQLSETGLRAEFLSSSDLLSMEPALMVAKEGSAAFLPDDSQLDAKRAVAFILECNRNFNPKGQYAEFYNSPVIGLLRSGGTKGIQAIQTPHNTLYSRKAIVVAAGCWTGSVMNALLRGSDITLNVPVKPRKGHLLVLENFDSLKLNHGLMELGYVARQGETTDSEYHDKALSISMTATVDSMGNLLLGSSRQFAGFNTEVDDSIIDLIWRRAGEFFPSLIGASLTDLCKSQKVRVGLRPYMLDRKPVIGPVPGLPNVFVAAGHEGEGLSLALGTAELVTDMALGNPTKVDFAPFSAQGRF